MKLVWIVRGLGLSHRKGDSSPFPWFSHKLLFCLKRTPFSYIRRALSSSIKKKKKNGKDIDFRRKRKKALLSYSIERKAEWELSPGVNLRRFGTLFIAILFLVWVSIDGILRKNRSFKDFVSKKEAKSEIFLRSCGKEAHLSLLLTFVLSFFNQSTKRVLSN